MGRDFFYISLFLNLEVIRTLLEYFYEGFSELQLQFHFHWVHKKLRLDDVTYGCTTGPWRVATSDSEPLAFHPCTVSPPYLRVLHPRIQPTTDQKYSEKNSRKFQKAKLEFAVHWQLFTQHLHCIYSYLHIICFVLGITSNPEMI